MHIWNVRRTGFTNSDTIHADKLYFDGGAIVFINFPGTKDERLVRAYGPSAWQTVTQEDN